MKHMFRIAPELKQMFSFKDIPDSELYDSQQLKKHGANNYKYIEQAVDGWGTPEVAEKLSKLGARHVTREVKMEHFAVVGEAMMTSLSEVFTDAFDDKTKELWTRVFTVIM